MRSEFTHALIENNVAFELSTYIFLHKEFLPKTYIDQYLGWVSDLQKSGVVIAFASDVHAKDLSMVNYEGISKVFEHYGIKTEDFFCL